MLGNIAGVLMKQYGQKIKAGGDRTAAINNNSPCFFDDACLNVYAIRDMEDVQGNDCKRISCFCV